MVDIKITDLPRKPFRCLKCGISFGETDGIRLYCGEYAIFTLKVTPTCARCGEPRTWRPVGVKNNLNSQETPAVITFVQHYEMNAETVSNAPRDLSDGGYLEQANNFADAKNVS